MDTSSCNIPPRQPPMASHGPFPRPMASPLTTPGPLSPTTSPLRVPFDPLSPLKVPLVPMTLTPVSQPPIDLHPALDAMLTDPINQLHPSPMLNIMKSVSLTPMAQLQPPLNTINTTLKEPLNQLPQPLNNMLNKISTPSLAQMHASPLLSALSLDFHHPIPRMRPPLAPLQMPTNNGPFTPMRMPLEPPMFNARSPGMTMTPPTFPHPLGVPPTPPTSPSVPRIPLVSTQNDGLPQATSSATQAPQDRMTSGSNGGSGGSGGSSRLPIFQDDLSFNDRRGLGGRSLFDDLQRQMDEDFSNMGLRSGLRRNKWGRDWDDDPNSIFKDFFELRPRNPKLGKISREDASSRESLDDNTTQTLFTEDPHSKTRMFQISFNVQDYSPEDIAVKVVDDSVLVEAKHVDTSPAGAQSTREFSRKIHIPKEVDPDKLSSTMSNDGILTIKAPVPPKYQSIAASSIGSPTGIKIEPAASSNFAPISSAQHYQAPPYSQYQYTAPSGYPSSPPPGPMSPPPGPMSPPPPQSSYYAPPPASQPRMSAPVPQMHPANTMTSSAAPMYYQQQPYTTMQQADYPPHMYAHAHPPPPQQQDFPPPPPPITPAESPLDIPTYTDTPSGRRMDLTLFLGPPYTPEDILVKVDGRTLVIEACHMEKKDKKTSKASMSREFELTEDINPQTVQANLTNDGHLKLAAMVPVGDEGGTQGDDQPPPPPASQEQQ